MEQYDENLMDCLLTNKTWKWKFQKKNANNVGYDPRIQVAVGIASEDFQTRRVFFRAKFFVQEL